MATTPENPVQPSSDAWVTADAASRDLYRTDSRASAPSRSASLDKPGDMIGPYKLLEMLGEGGFGCVWAAEQAQPLKRRVALKLLNPGMDTKTVLARFEQERHALALMDHPNIARVLDAGATASGRPYFVMELVRGVPITQYCDSARLSPRRRMELMQQVARAVQHAHTKGIIHRDIKPSNVLVTLHGDQPVPKVIDFGIAKATTQPLTDKTIYTEFRQLIGTPPYMSPEQAEMSGLDIDTRADVYALGALMYELLTGSPPVDPEALRRAGLAEMYRLIKETEPPKPSTKVSTIGDRLREVAGCRGAEPGRLSALLRGEPDWIVMKAMEKDRTRRYETAESLAADVGRYLSGEAVLAGPPSAGYRVKRFVKRHRVGVGVGVVIAVAVSISLLAMIWGYQVQRAAARNETMARFVLQGTVAQLESQVRETRRAQASMKFREAFYEEVRIDPPWPLQRVGDQDPERVLGEVISVRRELLGELHPETILGVWALAEQIQRPGELYWGPYEAMSDFFDFGPIESRGDLVESERHGLDAFERQVRAGWPSQVPDFSDFLSFALYCDLEVDTALRWVHRAAERLPFFVEKTDHEIFQRELDRFDVFPLLPHDPCVPDVASWTLDDVAAVRSLMLKMTSDDIVRFWSMRLHPTQAPTSARSVSQMNVRERAGRVWAVTERVLADRGETVSVLESACVSQWISGNTLRAAEFAARAEAIRWRRALLPNPVIRSIRAMSLFQLGRQDDARMILEQTRKNMEHPWAYDQPGARAYFDAAVKMIDGEPEVVPSEVAPASGG